MNIAELLCAVASKRHMTDELTPVRLLTSNEDEAEIDAVEVHTNGLRCLHLRAVADESLAKELEEAQSELDEQERKLDALREATDAMMLALAERANFTDDEKEAINNLADKAGSWRSLK